MGASVRFVLGRKKKKQKGKKVGKSEPWPFVKRFFQSRTEARRGELDEK